MKSSILAKTLTINFFQIFFPSSTNSLSPQKFSKFRQPCWISSIPLFTIPLIFWQLNCHNCNFFLLISVIILPQIFFFFFLSLFLRHIMSLSSFLLFLRISTMILLKCASLLIFPNKVHSPIKFILAKTLTINFYLLLSPYGPQNFSKFRQPCWISNIPFFTIPLIFQQLNCNNCKFFSLLYNIKLKDSSKDSKPPQLDYKILQTYHISYLPQLNLSCLIAILFLVGRSNKLWVMLIVSLGQLLINNIKKVLILLPW